jgi:peptide-methionine (R)-S-oxide reductase
MTPTRRTFLAAATATAAACLLTTRRSVFAARTADLPTTVTIVQFSAEGKAMGKTTVPRIVKSDSEWKKQLSPLSFDVTRREGTERPFSSDLELHDRGLFRCICCDNALFSSETKFDSHTGWPSFWKPIAKENVVETTDRSLGMARTAVSCRQCDAHLGHVFDDGPAPTGLRYCMNAVAMHFVKSA